jgi:hypothetical protein
MENAYSLVCNMWKVHTRPTSASDFFFKLWLEVQTLVVSISLEKWSV